MITLSPISSNFYILSIYFSFNKQKLQFSVDEKFKIRFLENSAKNSLSTILRTQIFQKLWNNSFSFRNTLHLKTFMMLIPPLWVDYLLHQASKLKEIENFIGKNSSYW